MEKEEDEAENDDDDDDVDDDEGSVLGLVALNTAAISLAQDMRTATGGFVRRA